MNSDELKLLEARFWDGETTEQEEEQLIAAAGRGEGVSGEFETYIQQMKLLKASEDVRIAFTPPSRQRTIQLWSIAASIIVVLGAALFLWQQREIQPSQEALTQKEYLEVKRAFSMLEENWDEGRKITSSQLNKVKIYPNKVSVNLK